MANGTRTKAIGYYCQHECYDADSSPDLRLGCQWRIV